MNLCLDCDRAFPDGLLCPNCGGRNLDHRGPRSPVMDPAPVARATDPSTSKGRSPKRHSAEDQIFREWIKPKPSESTWPSDSTLVEVASRMINKQQNRGDWARRRLDYERAGIIARRVTSDGTLITQRSPTTGNAEMTFGLTDAGARWMRD